MNDPRQVTRREALGLLAGAAAATASGSVLAGCSSSSAPRAKSGSPHPRLATPSASPSTAQTADWSSLAHRLHGELRRPGNAGYDEAYRLFDPRFDPVQPAAVATVAGPHDVAHCLSFARRFGLPISIRSGGHSYLGASTGRGLVIDVRGLKTVRNSPGAENAIVGAGAALVDVYSTLAADGVSVPGGSCPSVGISGLTLGGGVGVVGRQYGLTADSLAAAAVVTADGNVVDCDEAGAHSDLYWALRGGGGSFGVVTELTLATHQTQDLTHAYLEWPWSAAAGVMSAWQTWGPAAPRALWSACHLLSQDQRPAPPTVAVVAVYVGSSGGLDQHLDRLADAVPTAPTVRSVAEDGYGETMMLEAGCADLTVAACHVAAETPGGTLPRSAFIAASDYFDHPIPSAGITAIVNAVADRASDRRLHAGGVSLDILGGTIDDLGPSATAYVHRGALFNAQYTASWDTSTNAGQLARNRRSLASLHGALHPYATGQAYQNYADASLPDPRQAYYGGNLPRLIEVRRTYDPTGMFTQPQGVPLS